MCPAATARPSTILAMDIQVVEHAVIALVAVAVFFEEAGIAPVLGLVAGAVQVPTRLEFCEVVKIALRTIPVALLKRHVVEGMGGQYSGPTYYLSEPMSLPAGIGVIVKRLGMNQIEFPGSWIENMKT